VGDMHQLPFEDKSFDFVYSSLAVHYSDNPEMVYKEVYRVLKDNGQFLFSVGHPLRWASTKIGTNNTSIRLIGYTDDNDGKQEVYGNYHTFLAHEHFFPNNETLKFYVGSPSMHFKLLRKNGFLVEDFTESMCIEEAKEVDENYYKRYSEIPQFMAFLARKEK
jgi:SAM-dependent methyltransferase